MRNEWICVSVAWSLLSFLGSGYAQMLAHITQPVETPFGTYQPYLVSVQPSVPPLRVAADFSNVTNFGQFTFSEQELALLRQNHFVVTPRRLHGGTGFREMYDIYNEARELGIPILVTSDAMLHTFHLVFDNVLKTLEEQHFFGWLGELLAAIYQETLAQQAAAHDSLALWALGRNIEYLNVARALLDSTFVPQASNGLYLEEMKLIRQHLPFVPSPIFGYCEDYSQYIVRGHYTRSDSLRHYFSAMMWLGRMTFNREDAGFALAALLLAQALARARVEARPALEVWNDIYQPTVFFVGKSDDIGPDRYLELAAEVYGPSFEELVPDSVAEEARLQAFLRAVRDLAGPKIGYPEQPAGFRLMGQRFIPDSYVLDALVFDRIPDGRLMPRGLDVMAVLGSARAYQLLQEAPDWTLFPSYPAKLESLRLEFAAYPDSVWAQNVYWNWLYCLMPLLVRWGGGYPDWMQTLAWIDKDLFAALASWAELRHDTILYAKQSGTETGANPEAAGRQGYVEPNVHLYARLASLAQFMRAGLANRNLLLPGFASALERLHDVLLKLMVISEKELENRFLTPEEYETILLIGETMAKIAKFDEWVSGPTPEDEEEMPVVADVHTDPNSNSVLEVGVGYPYCIYAICPVEGELVVARGAGFSYFEFPWPAQDRLTDESWRQMLRKSAPTPPQWAESFLAEAQWENPTPGFYFNKCDWALLLSIELPADSVKVGTRVQAEVRYWGSADLVRVWLEDAEGKRAEADTVGPVVPGLVLASIATGSLSPGRAWVCSKAPWSGLLAGDTLHYRRSLFLQPRLDVRSEGGSAPPREWLMLRPWPNPFNGELTVALELPASDRVELVVFDASGRRVCLLHSGPLPAGRHTFHWYGRDESGAELPSGVYLVRLKGPWACQAQKAVLVR